MRGCAVFGPFLLIFNLITVFIHLLVYIAVACMFLAFRRHYLPSALLRNDDSSNACFPAGSARQPGTLVVLSLH